MTEEGPEVRVTKPLPVDRESKRAPSAALATLFVVGLLAIVLPLIGFVGAIALGSQAGVNFFTRALEVGFVGVGLLLAYGFAVGVYHTFLAVTGLDRGRRE